ncbi:MAG TPA: ribosome-associated translation inhibitor RaiA [Candidatus Eisenbacteria bacterium]|jgi:putative sigma-54 modulation protein|nr:ribosome-associated translation inhibitor RaiA [Candidatus Eisenbacteria bacterium]
MNLSLKGKGLSLTEAIKAAIEQKLAVLDKKVAKFGPSVNAEVEVGRTTKHHKKGELYRAEVHVRLPGKLVYAEALNKDLYAAIGAAVREASGQVASYKGLRKEDRRTAKKTKGGRESA